MKGQRLLALTIAACFVCGSQTVLAAQQAGTEKSENQTSTATDFITSKTDFDQLLRREYVDNVPLGYNENVFSLYQPGWGFDRDALYRTGIENGWGMPVSIKVDGVATAVQDAVFTPSYVTSTCQTGKGLTTTVNHAVQAAQASVSFDQRNYGCKLEFAFDGDKDRAPGDYWNANWNTWTSPIRTQDEWLEITFDEPVNVDAIRLYCYSEGASGNVAEPAAVTVQSWQGEGWQTVQNASIPAIAAGRNDLTFDRATSARFRLTFTPQAGKAMGFYEIELLEEVPVKTSLDITGYKYIAPDDKAVVIIEAVNPGETAVEMEVAASSTAAATAEGNALTGEAAGFYLRVEGDEGFTVRNSQLTKSVTIAPGESAAFSLAMAFAEDAADNAAPLAAFFADEEPLVTQKAAFQQWFVDTVPYADLPDEQLKQIYYFRWYTYRNNLRMTTDGYYVITEFLPNVGWSGKHNTINCPAGFHVAEGRWMKDNRYLDDYLTLWLDKGGAVGAEGGFSFWIASAYYDRYLVNQDPYVLRYVDKLKRNYNTWERLQYDKNTGLYWQYCGADGMENSVSLGYWGAGYRPTINSYQYGDAMAIAALCRLTGDENGAQRYAERAASIRAATNALLWDSDDHFYKQIERGKTALVEPREEIGFVPWMFNLPEDSEEYGRAWEALMDEEVFLSPYGPRTAEKAYARTPDPSEYGGGVCHWNGPSWPFATSQTLVGMANLLNNYTAQKAVDKNDYYTILKTYAKSQYKDGAPWLAENLDAETGRWLADCERSPNYNHSEYVDLIITGLLGIRPDDTEVLTVNPLVPDDWAYFCLENVPYHNRLVTLLYDRDGTRYNQGKGFRVYVDGECALAADTVETVRVPLTDDYWAGILNQIAAMDKGTVSAVLPEDGEMPAAVLQALQGKDIDLRLSIQGKDYVFSGLKLKNLDPGKAAYTAEELVALASQDSPAPITGCALPITAGVAALAGGVTAAICWPKIRRRRRGTA